MNYEDHREVKKMIDDNNPGCIAIIFIIAVITLMPTLLFEGYRRVVVLESRVRKIEAQHSITNATIFPNTPIEMLFDNEAKKGH